jgi:hypothetical protein
VIFCLGGKGRRRERDGTCVRAYVVDLIQDEGVFFDGEKEKDFFHA